VVWGCDGPKNASSMVILCAAVLPVGERHLGASRAQSEAAVSQMMALLEGDMARLQHVLDIRVSDVPQIEHWTTKRVLFPRRAAPWDLVTVSRANPSMRTAVLPNEPRRRP